MTDGGKLHSLLLYEITHGHECTTRARSRNEEIQKKLNLNHFYFFVAISKEDGFFVIFVTNFQFLSRFFSFQFSISFSSAENRFFGLIIILDRLSV
jgi:hypothetical protein